MDDDFLKDIANQRVVSRKLVKLPARRRNYFHKQALAGASTYWFNEFHPHALYFAAALAQTMGKEAQQTTFAAMLADLEEAARITDKHLLVTSDYAPQLDFNCLAQKRGFNLVRTTVEPRMPLAAAINGEANADAYDVVTLKDLQQQPALRAALVRESFRDYRQNHLVNPVADISPKQWAKVVFADQLEEIPLALTAAGKIRAYCFAFEDEPAQLTWGWMGATDPAILDQLQFLQLLWAEKYGYTVLTGEFDSTDPLATRTYRRLPFDLCPVYETFLKKLD